MKPQHLSDEAVAAFADGVLSGSARERAARHLDECGECRDAVRIQREAASVLRTAPAPALPTSLVDRLRTVPLTAPLPPPPDVVGPDGNAVLAAFAPMSAFAPAPRTVRHRGRTYLTAAAVTAALVAGGVAATTASSSDDPANSPVHPVNHVRSGTGPVGVLFHGPLGR